MTDEARNESAAMRLRAGFPPGECSRLLAARPRGKTGDRTPFRVDSRNAETGLMPRLAEADKHSMTAMQEPLSTTNASLPTRSS